MSMHEGLPVAGYKPQTTTAVDRVNSPEKAIRAGLPSRGPTWRKRSCRLIVLFSSLVELRCRKMSAA
jgi:hypothetical protein